jgi:hypothetical protein
VTIKTPLLSIIGLGTLTVLSADEVAAAHAAADIGEGTRTEIVLAIDVSRIMENAMQPVAEAAGDLIDIIAASAPDAEHHRFAVVPFADTVSLTPAIAQAARGRLRAGTCHTAGCQQFERNAACRDGACDVERVLTAGACAAERSGPESATDAPPAVAPLMPLYPNRFGSCRPTLALQPLTTDRDAVKRHLSALDPGGAAAGHHGLAWAWYVLSPRWSAIWGEAAGADYDLLDVRFASGARALRKIVVLISPGSFNRQYCEGVADDTPGACSSPNRSSHAQARALCRAMAARDLEIFAVGYPWSEEREAGATLRDTCASKPGHFFPAETADALKQALRDIGLRIAATRLTN